MAENLVRGVGAAQAAEAGLNYDDAQQRIKEFLQNFVAEGENFDSDGPPKMKVCLILFRISFVRGFPRNEVPSVLLILTADVFFYLPRCYSI